MLHGRGHSFASRAQWLKVRAAVVAQIKGHKPRTSAKKRSKVRPLDLLRLRGEKINLCILEHTSIAFGANTSAECLPAAQ